MVRISSAFVVIASVVGLAQAAFDVNKEFKSIGLCQETRHLYQQWQGLKLTAEISAKEHDEPKRQSFTVLAQKAEQDFYAVYDQAMETVVADLNLISRAQQSVLDDQQRIRVEKDRHVNPEQWARNQALNLEQQTAELRMAINAVKASYYDMLQMDVKRKKKHDRINQMFKSTVRSVQGQFDKMKDAFGKLSISGRRQSDQ